MKIVKNLSLSKLIRINQNDLDEALRDFCVKKNIVEDTNNYKVSFPKLGSSDLIVINYKLEE